MAAKCKAPVYCAVSVHMKDPQAVYINPEPSTTVSLIAHVAVRFKPHIQCHTRVALAALGVILSSAENRHRLKRVVRGPLAGVRKTISAYLHCKSLTPCHLLGQLDVIIRLLLCYLLGTFNLTPSPCDKLDGIIVRRRSQWQIGCYNSKTKESVFVAHGYI